MRNLTSILLLSVLAPAPVHAYAPDEIPWFDSISEARKDAERDAKPVILYLKYEGCDWCQKVTDEIFPHPVVIDRAVRMNWVEVDRDDDPQLTKRFNVTNFPSFLVIGEKDENIHRFDGLKTLSRFVDELELGVAKYDKYLAGEDWTKSALPIPLISDEGQIRELPAPSEDRPSGVAYHDGMLYVAQDKKLYRVDPLTGKRSGSFTLPPRVVDICSDGEFLYAVEYGWSSGRPIHIIDPNTGKALHQIVTEGNQGRKASSTMGITAHDGKLIVAANHGTLYIVEKETGDVLQSVRTPVKSIKAICHDGKHLVAATDQGLSFFEGAIFKPVGRIRTHHKMRSVGYGEGEFFLLGQPTYGYGKDHERVRTWPEKTRVYALMPTADTTK